VKQIPAALDGEHHQRPDVADVTRLLGRTPECNFTVVARRPDGTPTVICNDPLMFDGTPMPTQYWLVDPELRAAVSRLEAEGGVKDVQTQVSLDAIARAHMEYARMRDARIPENWTRPRPSGGVGGTRRGVKCLHAHLAWWLVGGDDPVGAWTATRIGLSRPTDENVITTDE
jgi:hypothetical protein